MEIDRREPEFLPRFQLAFPCGSARADCYNRHPALKDRDSDALDQAVTSGVGYLRRRGIKVEHSATFEDPVSKVFFDGFLDAFAAGIGRLPLSATRRQPKPFADVLGEQYDTRTTAGGRRYIIRRKGSRVLLLMNALGIPLGLWAKFLADETHDFRIVTVENRCGDLANGGMASDATLTQHADDILDVLEHEGIRDLDVLAWCNSGRISVDLVTRGQLHVRSLVLLSPTFRGTRAGSREPSQFEERLQQIFETVAKNEALARPLVSMISRFAAPPDWDTLAGNPAARAAALFSMPAREHATAFLQPMSVPSFLANYGRRTAADEAYPMTEALERLAQSSVPVLLATGSHDSMVNNQATLTALRSCGVPVIHAEISGAGHYVQDLQYPYFLWTLRNFTEKHGLPCSALRVTVDCSGN